MRQHGFESRWGRHTYSLSRNLGDTWGTRGPENSAQTSNGSSKVLPGEASRQFPLRSFSSTCLVLSVSRCRDLQRRLRDSTVPDPSAVESLSSPAGPPDCLTQSSSQQERGTNIGEKGGHGENLKTSPGMVATRCWQGCSSSSHAIQREEVEETQRG